jgi:hypothetical protein
MRFFLRGLPLMLPCTACRDHATAFIEEADLNAVTLSREALAKFFVDMHNRVNKVYGKAEMPYDLVVAELYPFRDLLS